MVFECVLKVFCILIFVLCFMMWFRFMLMRLRVGSSMKKSSKILNNKCVIYSVLVGLF